ncbi:hypothetical protein NKH18_28380 [Streptomyces sp. M10(2022)]
MDRCAVREEPAGGSRDRHPVQVGLYHDNDNFAVTDGSLTVDITGIAGVAEVTWPDNCVPTGTTAVCSVPQVPTIGSDYSPQVNLQVRAVDGAEPGRRAVSPTRRPRPEVPRVRWRPRRTPSTRRSGSAPVLTSR